VPGRCKLKIESMTNDASMQIGELVQPSCGVPVQEQKPFPLTDRRVLTEPRDSKKGSVKDGRYKGGAYLSHS